MTEQNNALAVFAGQVTGDIANLVDRGGYEDLFFVLQQGSGAPVFRNQDLKDKGLDGRDTITGVYIGHRFNVIAYPAGYNTNLGKNQEDPVYGGAAPGNGPLAKLAKDAASAYQFTKAAERSKFDHSTENPAGHVRVSMEFLVYVPAIGEAVVLRTYNHYNGIFARGRALDRLLRHSQGGVIPPVPMNFVGRTAEGYGGKDVQWVDTEVVADRETAESFAEWVELAKEDEKTLQDINTWLTALDNPLSDSALEALRNVVALNPPR